VTGPRDEPAAGEDRPERELNLNREAIEDLEVLEDQAADLKAGRPYSGHLCKA
jgi:hypothetical protein